MEPLTLPCSEDALAPIRTYVTGAATRAGLDRLKASRLRLAVDEIATNSVEHGGCNEGQPGTLAVAAEIEDHSVRIILEDDNAPFDPLTVPLKQDADLNVPLEQRRSGGLGIHIAVTSVDQFLYERAADRNRYIFIVK